MQIYHDKRTRSLRAVWMAEEMGLDYEVIPGALGSPELLAVNSSNTLPAFVDGDVIITESMAIVQYLAGRYGPTPLVPDPADPCFGAYLQFLWLGEASLAAPMTAKIMNQFFAPEAQKGGWIADYMQTSLPKRISLVTAALSGSDYVAGGRFTAADISVFYALNLLELIGLTAAVTHVVSAYRARIMERPAYRRALAKG